MTLCGKRVTLLKPVSKRVPSEAMDFVPVEHGLDYIHTLMLLHKLAFIPRTMLIERRNEDMLDICTALSLYSKFDSVQRYYGCIKSQTLRLIYDIVCISFVSAQKELASGKEDTGGESGDELLESQSARDWFLISKVSKK